MKRLFARRKEEVITEVLQKETEEQIIQRVVSNKPKFNSLLNEKHN